MAATSDSTWEKSGLSVASIAVSAFGVHLTSAPASPFAGDVPRQYAKDAVWVEPRLVAEVEYTEWTKDDRLRHPSYKGLREDVSPTEVTREQQ